LRCTINLQLKLINLFLFFKKLLILFHNRRPRTSPIIGHGLSQLLEQPHQIPASSRRLHNLMRRNDALPQQLLWKLSRAIEHPRRHIGRRRQWKPPLNLQKHPELIALPDHRMRRQPPQVLLQRQPPLFHELLLLHHLALHHALIRPRRNKKPAVRLRQPIRKGDNVTEPSPDTEFGAWGAEFGNVRRRGDQIGHVTVASRNNRIRGFLLLDGVRNGYIQILRARRRRSRDGEGKSRRRSVDAVCFAIKGRENGFSIGRRVEVRGSVGGVRVWKVLRRGEKGIGVCRGGDNRRRERVVVEKRRCVCVAQR